MRYTYLFSCLKVASLLFIGLSSYSQEFQVKVSSDTILAGNVLNLTFKANNVAGQFEAPDLQGFKVVSGPNTSTSMSMINGEVTQSSNYSFIILADEIGEYTILPAYLETQETTLETEVISVVVIPNPEGIIEHPPVQSGYFEFGFPQTPTKPKAATTPKKKKRKLKKI